MARFVVVVLILLAIAFLANKYLIGKGDPRPADAKAPAADATNPDATDPEASRGVQPPGPAAAPLANRDAADEAVDAAPAKAAAKDVVTPGENAAAEAAPSADVATDLQQEAGVEPKVDGVESTDPTPAEIRAVTEPETVKLGDPSLTAGVPGDGSLTLEQIEKWLADPKNHVALKPELPLGLKAGEAEIKGLEENTLTRAKIELGRQLFFDQRLSADLSISCASCHVPETGYASNTTFGVGVRKQEGNRNSPVAYNRIFSGPQFWDGRAPTLEEQAKGPIANPIEMSNTHEACVASLKKVPGYVKQFEGIFKDGLNIENAAKAIAAFERILVTAPAPWDIHQELTTFETAYEADIEDLDALKEEDQELYDEYMAFKSASEKSPISESAVRGGELFFSDKAGCTACHLGVNFTDEKFHNLGVGMEADEPDLGRFKETNLDADRGAFKTPTCRNVAMTAPYMHDGSQKTLEEVVEWYAKGGHPNPHLSEKVKKLDLTDQDKKDLVAFMKEGLTSELPKVERTRLPTDPEAAAENRQENREAIEEEAKEEEAKEAA